MLRRSGAASIARAAVARRARRHSPMRRRSSARTRRRPTARSRGFAVGAGLLIVGFEFEYANTPRRSRRAGARRSRPAWATCCCRRRSRSSASSRTSRPARALSRALGTHTGHGFAPEHGRRREDLAGGPAAAARRLSGVQAGKRCAVFASAPHLRRTESEVLSRAAYLPESPGRSSVRLTMFMPCAYASAYFLQDVVDLRRGNASARMFEIW